MIRYFILLLLVGCAHVKPYGEVGLGYQEDSQTDFMLQTGRPWECSKNVPFDATFGLETKTHWRFSVTHDSWALCGTGLNNDPETYKLRYRVSKEWGGW